jgi:hypothetical protein
MYKSNETLVNRISTNMQSESKMNKPNLIEFSDLKQNKENLTI